MSSAITYKLAIESWTSAQPITIVDAQGTTIARIPLDFIRQGGVNHWSYILDVVRCCLSDDSTEGGVLLDAAGLQPDEPHVGGVYTFVIASDPARIPTLAPGPDLLHPGSPAPDGSTQAAQSRSPSPSPELPPTVPRMSLGGDGMLSENLEDDMDPKASFRMRLEARDGVCLISGDAASVCQAAHLVPIHRTDVYTALFGDEATTMTYATSMGILLRADLHILYDMLKIGIWTNGTIAVAHVFVKEGLAPNWHGAAWSLNLKHKHPHSPNIAALQWHYRRCVQARFRGTFVCGVR